MIGEKLGKYTIIESLGTGSMGVVYRAEDPASGKQVAIKLVRTNVLYDSKRRERFLQGLLAASEIRHTRLCPILEIGDEDDDFFIVSPFLQGETLAHFLHSNPLHWPEALEVALAAGEALAAVHLAGTIHRAFKPQNIWLQNGGSIILTDCCVARFTEIERTASAEPRGPKIDFADTIIPLSALAYMSPEQIRGDSLDFGTDIFSFGIVLYEMLAGRHPFEARNSLSRMSAILEAEPVPPSERRPSLPKSIDGIVLKALAKDSRNRHQTMGEILDALRLVHAKPMQAFSKPATDISKYDNLDIRRAILAGGIVLLATFAYCTCKFVPK